MGQRGGRGKAKRRKLDPSQDSYYQGTEFVEKTSNNKLTKERRGEKREREEKERLEKEEIEREEEEKEAKREEKRVRRRARRKQTAFEVLIGKLANEEGGPETVKERKRKERERREQEERELREKQEKEARERRVKEEEERKLRRKRKRPTEEEDIGEVLGDSDPFKEHFFCEIDGKLAEQHQQQKKKLSHTSRSSSLGNIFVSSEVKQNPSLFSWLIDPSFTSPPSLSSAFLKERLKRGWIASRDDSSSSPSSSSSSSSSSSPSVFSPTELQLLSLLSSYTDVVHTENTYNNNDNVREVMAAHVVNHILKVRDTVLKNNEKSKAGEIVPDQGFTRPRVLIVTSFRGRAGGIVREILRFLPQLQSDRVANKKRFDDEFGDGEEMVEEEEEEVVGGGVRVAGTTVDPRKKKEARPKPLEWRQTFKGNCDDCFTLGLSISRKTVKLYSDFYKSDIIITSPVGLMRVIQHGDEETKLLGVKSGHYDFLSSIEIAMVDAADVLLMQNWQHVQTIFSHLNRTPKESHDTDFGRVRPWVLNEHGPVYRQNIIISRYFTPEISALVSNFSKNRKGVVRFEAFSGDADELKEEGEEEEGEKEEVGKKVFGGVSVPAVLEVVPQVKQVFVKVVAQKGEEGEKSMGVVTPEDRFKFFESQIYPRLKSVVQTRTVIFIPSYFDYVRIRDLFKQDKSRVKYRVITEYTSASDISRARTALYEGKIDYLLTTERFHFYKRYFLRGMRNIYFYAPPNDPRFYRDYLNMMSGDAEGLSCMTFFSDSDWFALKRVVGENRAKEMLGSKQDVFAFSS